MDLKYTNRQSGIGEIERLIIDTMTRLGEPIITADSLEKEFGYKRAKSNLMLSRLCRKGWLQRLKSGVYRIIPLGSDTANPMPEDAWSIAMKLFSPCYISGWTAAEHWDLTEQIFNSTVIFTGKKQKKKNYNVAGLIYRTKFMSPEKFFGIQKIWSSNQPIQIADLHRTIIDILDDPEIGGGGRHIVELIKAYWHKKEANSEILLQYAEKLNHGAVFKRLGFLAEAVMQMPDTWLEKLHPRIKSGVINFDPNGPTTGPIISKWGMRINIPMEDIS